MALPREAVPSHCEACVGRLTAESPHGGDRDEGAPTPAIRWRTVIIGLIVGVPISVLFLWLAIRGVNLHEVWTALRDTNLWLVLLAVPFVNLLFPCQGLRWRHLVEAHPKPDRAPFIALVFLGGAINNIVPGRPGDIVRGVWLSRYGDIPVARSLTSVGIDRAVDVITVLVMMIACLPFVPRPNWLVNLVIIGAALSAGVGLTLAAAWWYSNRSATGQARANLEKDDRSWLRHHLSGVVRGLSVLSHPRDLGWALFDSALGWGVTTVGFWLVALAVHIHLGLAEIVFVTAIIALGSAIPSSPGLIGTYQWLAVTAMAVVGAGRADAIAYSVLLQASWFIPVTLSGPIVGWWLMISKRTMPARSNHPAET